MAVATALPRAMMLTIQTTDLPVSFPEYSDPFESSADTIMASPSPSHKLVNKLRDDVDRHPSPQPSHISSLPRTGGNGHRILRSATVGYVAPEFKEKSQQMKEGMWCCRCSYF